ncbi:PilZ domain-containing protein [Gimesia aquarii]|uniref:PilZ domain-containing protein n=1 Tax=Gimesia aquarii TaxID=2527964 RepID=A0A517VRF5_9PLAN|nr:PilZ domain-containing protein [Gimesia aquarii]QDT95598.1 hypothetical protein V144x_10430 [Gimesia aquarii]
MKTFTDFYEYSQEQQQLLPKVVNLLSQIEERAKHIYGKQRAHPRIDFRGLIVISFSIDFTEPIEIYSGEMITVLGRSVSQSGISLICPDHIAQEELFLKLPLSQSIDTWFSSKIVRKRRILDAFWEYGIQFQARLDV